MRNPLSLSLFVGACCCAFVLIAEGLPANNNGRFKRETTTDNASSSSAAAASSEGSSSSNSSSSTSTAEPTPTSSSSSSSSTSEPPHSNKEFGLGAVAGIVGLNRGVGIGNFQFPTSTKNDPLTPWGAFAGLNLGNGGRIGAGCQGLSCGVQLGHFVLGTPQLLNLGQNILNPQQRNAQNNGPDGKKLADETQTLSETNFNPNPGNPNINNFAISPANPDDIRVIFRDAFRGFRETLASFFRAPVTHFIKKDRAFQIDNSTESAVGPVRSATAASEQKTYRIQLTPPKSTVTTDDAKDSGERENELE